MKPLSKLVADVAAATLGRFESQNLLPDDFSITVGQFLSFPYSQASYHGDDRMYPASVVKLFYLAAAHRWLEDGHINDTPELRRALKDMIVESSNDATSYVIDLITDTTSGPELGADEMGLWKQKRNVINDYFKTLGYMGMNLNQKPWGDGPYGREKVFVGHEGHNRNMLTTNMTARLLHDIIAGTCISAERSEQMKVLLQRDQSVKSEDLDDQATRFFAAGLPRDARIWSKAGWTSKTRHDAAYIELAGMRFILVVYTINHAKNYEIIPFIASEVVKQLF